MHQRNRIQVLSRALVGFGFACAGVIGFARPARANINIIPTFDSTITSDPNAATIEASINAVIARLQNNITNNTTVHITYGEVTSGLGQSSTAINTFSYSTYLNALKTKQTLSSNDNSALASLPTQTNNPVNNNANVRMTSALARGLGLITSGGTDSTIGINMSLCNISRTGTQNPSFYDLQAVVAHETDECLDVGGPGTELPTTNSAVGPLDLFRYSAAGTRSFTTSTSAKAYLSIDGGVTNIVNFNQTGGGADYADWASSSTHRVQDAFGTPNTQLDIGPAELTALDVVGWDMVQTPEPASLGLIAFGALGLVGRRRSIN